MPSKRTARTQPPRSEDSFVLAPSREGRSSISQPSPKSLRVNPRRVAAGASVVWELSATFVLGAHALSIRMDRHRSVTRPKLQVGGGEVKLGRLDSKEVRSVLT